MGKSFEKHWLMHLPLPVLLMESAGAPARTDTSHCTSRKKRSVCISGLRKHQSMTRCRRHMEEVKDVAEHSRITSLS